MIFAAFCGIFPRPAAWLKTAIITEKLKSTAIFVPQ
jgi:hypothetical protein